MAAWTYKLEAQSWNSQLTCKPELRVAFNDPDDQLLHLVVLI
jgi:hypothetical protein